LAALVSVVIPSLDHPSHAIKCLEYQTFQDFEIILAPEKGIVQAMNIALEKAKGEIFVRIDDDVDLPMQWLEELIKPFSNTDVVGVTGPTYVPIARRVHRDSIRLAENPNWFLKWMFDGGDLRPAGIYKCGSVSYDSNYQEKIKDYVNIGYQPDHLEGTNWAMRTHLIKQVGGFDEAFDGVCEWFDTDVEQKILKLRPYDNKLVYNPKAFLWHLLEKGDHFNERFEMLGRIENWLRFHWRHSKLHPKMLVWLTMMLGYALCPRKQ
jgi:GT2 family glycosyltransferase